MKPQRRWRRIEPKEPAGPRGRDRHRSPCWPPGNGRASPAPRSGAGAGRCSAYGRLAGAGSERARSARRIVHRDMGCTGRTGPQRTRNRWSGVCRRVIACRQSCRCAERYGCLAGNWPPRMPCISTTPSSHRVKPLPSNPPNFTRPLFDGMADFYDMHMVRSLKYQLPKQVADKIIARHPDKKLNVLDLGCGTGLIGCLPRPHRRSADRR